MCEDRNWGSDVELFVAAAMFEINIFVYSKYGNKYDWLLFPSSEVNKNLSSTPEQAIYLNHTGLVHYDVVTNVEEVVSVIFFFISILSLHKKYLDTSLILLCSRPCTNDICVTNAKTSCQL